MQFQDDAELLEAVSSPIRAFGHRVLIDWAGDTNYAHPFSNLSAAVETVVMESALTGDLPPELSVVEGYSTSRLTITLTGDRWTGEMPLVEAFQPYRTDSPLYGVRMLGK